MCDSDVTLFSALLVFVLLVKPFHLILSIPFSLFVAKIGRTDT